MITNEGKARIKRYLAGQGGVVASSIAVGVMPWAAALTDTRLAFEVERFDVDFIGYDHIEDALVFKGTLPAEFAGRIYEAGLWSAATDEIAGDAASRLLTTFDGATEDWTNETLESAIARIGVDSLKHTPALSTSVTSALADLEMDLSGYSGADEFRFAINTDNTNAASVAFRFLTDASNHYTFTFTNVGTTGYQLLSAAKSTATVVGSPSWSDIISIEVTTVAKAAGAASVEFDGIRIEDVDTVNPEYALVARKVLPSPLVKVQGRALTFEYALDVNL